jgi:(1->4)-alpha-D-glucan 1-alpha-D-glucosylmutase
MAVDGVVTDELRGRLHAYAEKAIREAAVHTTWNDPDTDVRDAVHTGWTPSWTDRSRPGSASLVTRLTNTRGTIASARSWWR